MPNTKIVILAAGKGKRLASLGHDVPKGLVPILGKPLLSYLLDSVASSNVDSNPIVVVAPDTVDVFNETLNEYTWQPAIQEKQLGTGHAVGCAKDLFLDADSVMVLNGDHATTSAETIQRLSEEHASYGATITLATVQFPDFEGWRKEFLNFGRIVRSESGDIKEIIEAKDTTEEQYHSLTEVNPTYLIFKQSWLSENIDNITNNNAQNEYYLVDLLKMAFEQGEKIHSFVIDDPIEAIGINTPEQLKAAEEALKDRN